MLEKLIPGIIGLAAGIGFVLWFQVDKNPQLDETIFQARVPGTDKVGVGSTVGTLSPQQIKDTWPVDHAEGPGKPSSYQGAWPQFRGATRDALIPEGQIKLASHWGSDGPPKIWTRTVGEGHAGAAVRNGRVYLLDYDSEKRCDVMRCMSLDDGQDIWTASYPVMTKRSHGITRTVPSLAGSYVVGLGPKCHVTCFDAMSGELKWKLDLVNQFGTKIPTWYAGQCPFVDGERVILAPAGPQALMLAVELATGKEIWRTPNPKDWKMTHVSLGVTTLGKRKIYLYTASGGLVGVDAADGKLLFEVTEWKIQIAAVATPLPVGDDRIFLCGGYGVGSMMIQLAEEGDKVTAKPIFRLEPEQFGSAQHTPVLYKNHLFGVRPNQHFVCLDLNGKETWSSTSTYKFGIGPYMIADGKILVVDNNAKLYMAEASTTEFKLIAEAQILDGHDSWGPMAMAGTRLLMRDLTRLICLEMGAP